MSDLPNEAFVSPVTFDYRFDSDGSMVLSVTDKSDGEVVIHGRARLAADLLNRGGQGPASAIMLEVQGLLQFLNNRRNNIPVCGGPASHDGYVWRVTSVDRREANRDPQKWKVTLRREAPPGTRAEPPIDGLEVDEIETRVAWSECAWP